MTRKMANVAAGQPREAGHEVHKAEATAALASSAAASAASKGDWRAEARRDIRAGAKRPAGHVILLNRLLLLLEGC